MCNSFVNNTFKDIAAEAFKLIVYSNISKSTKSVTMFSSTCTKSVAKFSSTCTKSVTKFSSTSTKSVTKFSSTGTCKKILFLHLIYYPIVYCNLSHGTLLLYYLMVHCYLIILWHTVTLLSYGTLPLYYSMV